MLCQLSYRGSRAARRNISKGPRGRRGNQGQGPTSSRRRLRAPRAAAPRATARVLGVDALVELVDPSAHRPARGRPAGDHPDARDAPDGDVPLQHHAGGHPLADQLEQPARLLDRELVLARAPPPQVPTSRTRNVAVSWSQSAASTCSQGTRRAPRASRARRGCRRRRCRRPPWPTPAAAPPARPRAAGRATQSRASRLPRRSGRAGCGGAARGRRARRTSCCTPPRARPGWSAAAATSARRCGAAR